MIERDPTPSSRPFLNRFQFKACLTGDFFFIGIVGGLSIISEKTVGFKIMMKIKIDLFIGKVRIFLDLRFYFLGSSRPSGRPCIVGTGLLVYGEGFFRFEKFKSAGRNVNPAIMQVATPTVIT